MEDLLIKEFIAESLDGLDRMERCLTELESDPTNAALLADIFRTVHTIKGTTGFLGFQRMEKLAHVGENLLGAMRDGKLLADPEIINVLLEVMDVFRSTLDLIQLNRTEGARKEDDDAPLIERIRILLPVISQRPVATPAKARSTPKPPIARLQELPSSPQPEPPPVVPIPPPPVDAKPPLHAATPEQSLRVDVEVLNRMMNLVGELVLTRNQLLQTTLSADNLSTLVRRLDAVTADLRETVMQARMQPVGQLFGKFPRMVRDLARTCDKQVRIEFSGQETGLDKSLLEAIKDPLIHAVRNAIDHGIETPEARLARGKSAEGLIRLRAFHQSGSVVVEMSDDGAGVSIPRVIEKAIENGLITEQRAATLSEREALQLLFLPGFSTARTITQISGRGVGMDVVRLNVETVGGTVELESHFGQGTTLRMRVPLTLAIVPALVVRSGDQSFCLPQSALAELIYIPRNEVASSFERIGDAELYRLREKLLPVVWFDQLLRASHLANPQLTSPQHGLYLAVLEAEGFRYGLAIDDLLAPEEIVVKPLSAVLREIGLFSGATVLGNGTLALILDVSATAERAGIRKAEQYIQPVTPIASLIRATSSFLTFQTRKGTGQAERIAIPLDVVERIESIPLRQIEFADGRSILQYHGDLLVIHDPDALLPELQSAGPDTPVTVLICLQPPSQRHPAGRRVGMVIRQVLDIADGSVLESDEHLSLGPLAIVDRHLAVLHNAFGEAPQFGRAA